MADEDKAKPEEAEEGAEGAEGADGEDGEDTGPKGGRKLIIILALASILIGGSVAAGVFLFLGGEEPPAEEAVANVDPLAELADVAFFDMPQISANLLADGRGGRFLQLKVSLELESELDLETVKVVLPRLQDEFQTFLRQLRVEDIKGSAGMQRLREGLLLRAQQSAAPARVRNVLFKEITIQ